MQGQARKSTESTDLGISCHVPRVGTNDRGDLQQESQTAYSTDLRLSTMSMRASLLRMKKATTKAKKEAQCKSAARLTEHLAALVSTMM